MKLQLRVNKNNLTWVEAKGLENKTVPQPIKFIQKLVKQNVVITSNSKSSIPLPFQPQSPYLNLVSTNIITLLL